MNDMQLLYALAETARVCAPSSVVTLRLGTPGKVLVIGDGAAVTALLRELPADFRWAWLALDTPGQGALDMGDQGDRGPLRAQHASALRGALSTRSVRVWVWHVAACVQASQALVMVGHHAGYQAGGQR